MLLRIIASIGSLALLGTLAQAVTPPTRIVPELFTDQQKSFTVQSLSETLGTFFPSANVVTRGVVDFFGGVAPSPTNLTNTITIGSKTFNIGKNTALRVTTFGGINDDFGIREATRIGGTTGIAYPGEVNRTTHPEIFLSTNDPSLVAAETRYGLTSGQNLFAGLNEDAYYVATQSRAPGAIIIVENPRTGEWVTAVNADFGPGEVDATGNAVRVDTSKGVQNAIGLRDGETANIYFAEDQEINPGTRGIGGRIISDTPPPAEDLPSTEGPLEGDIDADFEPKTEEEVAEEEASTEEEKPEEKPKEKESEQKSSTAGFIGNVACGGAPWCVETGPQARFCYKYKGAAGPKGLHEGVLTCNAGVRCLPAGPKANDPFCGVAKIHLDVPDCGIEGRICNKLATIKKYSNQYACLWLACSKGKNAIWDKDTKKCGCDDGSGFGGGGGGGDDNQQQEQPPEESQKEQSEEVTTEEDNTTTEDTAPEEDIFLPEEEVTPIEPETPSWPSQETLLAQKDAQNRKALEIAGVEIDPKVKSLGGLSDGAVDGIVKAQKELAENIGENIHITGSVGNSINIAQTPDLTKVLTGEGLGFFDLRLKGIRSFAGVKDVGGGIYEIAGKSGKAVFTNNGTNWGVRFESN